MQIVFPSLNGCSILFALRTSVESQRGLNTNNAASGRPRSGRSRPARKVHRSGAAPTPVCDGYRARFLHTCLKVVEGGSLVPSFGKSGHARSKLSGAFRDVEALRGNLARGPVKHQRSAPMRMMHPQAPRFHPRPRRPCNPPPRDEQTADRGGKAAPRGTALARPATSLSVSIHRAPR